MESKVSKRNNYLDWLRVLGILAVFVYHSSRFFNLEYWHIKNATTYAWVEVWNRFATSWMMPLMFAISGASLFYAVGKSKAGKFIGDKVLRLMVPLVVCAFTHASLQVYLEQNSHGVFSGTYGQFLPLYFFDNFEPMGMHLWYLLVLFVFSLLLYPLMRWLKGPGNGVLSRIGDWLALPGAVYALALPTILLALLYNPENELTAIYAGWTMITYLWIILVGFVIVSHPGLQAGIQKQRWLSLPVGLLLVGFSIAWFGLGEGPSIGSVSFAWGWVLRSLGSWCLVLAILGFAIQHLNMRLPWLNYANEAVLPFYILHQTVLVVVGYFVVQWSIPDVLKWVIILVVSFGLIMGLYEYLVRRFNLLRFLFGMKLIKRRSIEPAIEPVLEDVGRIR